MLATASERTLAEDWLVRRQRLTASQTVPEQQRAMQLQVLDYLIRRYGDSVEAAQPARFASTVEFYCNERAIAVNHHLGGAIAGIKNQGQANRRVGAILNHLRSVHDDDHSPPPGADFAQWIDKVDERPKKRVWIWRDVWRSLKPYQVDRRVDEMIKRMRGNKGFDDYLRPAPSEFVQWVIEIDKCPDRRLSARDDPWRDAIRRRLADSDPELRLAAIGLLRMVGTLDDVALLSDLLSLPPTADEEASERPELQDAMWAIAHRERS